MDKIKGVIKANLAKDPFDIIFWSDPSVRTYEEALSIYRSSSMNEKHQIEKRAYRKLQKSKQPKIGLAILCLLDYIIHQGYSINLSDIKPSISTQQCKSEKQKLSQQAFFKFYQGILTSEQNKSFKAKQFDSQNIYKQVEYCQISIKSIFKVIMFDFLIDHCLSHSEHKQITNIIINRILKIVQIDLQILNRFLNNNAQKITLGHELCFNINEIYEKSLFFSKQADRLNRFNRKCGNNLVLQFYKYNRELNQKIQNFILSKDLQRRQFVSQRNIASIANNEEESYNLQTCPNIIAEESILIKDDIFMC